MRNKVITFLLLTVMLTAGCTTEEKTSDEKTLVVSTTTTLTTSTSTQEKTLPETLNNSPDNTYVNSLDRQSMENTVERVEVYHFHGNQQCYSCKTVGQYAEDTVNTYFSNEMKSGKLVYAHINRELPENKDLVEKYKVTGASLQIGVYTKNGFSHEENVNVWYKIENKDAYMSYLKGVIEKRLKGDMSN